MPVYLHCPHCEHPQVISATRRGKALLCKQCGRAYKTSQHFNFAQPLAASSLGELRGIGRRGGQSVVVIDGV